MGASSGRVDLYPPQRHNETSWIFHSLFTVDEVTNILVKVYSGVNIFESDKIWRIKWLYLEKYNI